MSTTTVHPAAPDLAEDPTPALPTGHDNPKSPHFVPTELRPFWPSAATQRSLWLQEMERADLHRDRNLQLDLPSVLARRAIHALHRRRIPKEYGHDWSPQQAQQRAKNLTDQDNSAYFHDYLLRIARQRMTKTERSTEFLAAKVASQTCQACRQVTQTTAGRVFDELNGNVRSTGSQGKQFVQLCTPCALALDHIAAERAAAEKVNGTTRADLVAAYLTAAQGN